MKRWQSKILWSVVTKRVDRLHVCMVVKHINMFELQPSVCSNVFLCGKAAFVVEWKRWSSLLYTDSHDVRIICSSESAWNGYISIIKNDNIVPINTCKMTKSQISKPNSCSHLAIHCNPCSKASPGFIGGRIGEAWCTILCAKRMSVEKEVAWFVLASPNPNFVWITSHSPCSEANQKRVRYRWISHQTSSLYPSSKWTCPSTWGWGNCVICCLKQQPQEPTKERSNIDSVQKIQSCKGRFMPLNQPAVPKRLKF